MSDRDDKVEAPSERPDTAAHALIGNNLLRVFATKSDHCPQRFRKIRAETCALARRLQLVFDGAIEAPWARDNYRKSMVRNDALRAEAVSRIWSDAEAASRMHGGLRNVR